MNQPTQAGESPEAVDFLRSAYETSTNARL
jgi:hypothetical protein